MSNIPGRPDLPKRYTPKRTKGRPTGLWLFTAVVLLVSFTLLLFYGAITGAFNCVDAYQDGRKDAAFWWAFLSLFCTLCLVNGRSRMRS